MGLHRWSGWPGAFCLRCGAEDPREVCLGDNFEFALLCVCGQYVCRAAVSDEHHLVLCPHHPMTDCEAHENEA